MRARLGSDTLLRGHGDAGAWRPIVGERTLQPRGGARSQRTKRRSGQIRAPRVQCEQPLELEAQCVLHLPSAVSYRLGSGPAKQRVARSYVRVGPHQRVGEVIRLKPELQFIALPDREGFG